MGIFVLFCKVSRQFRWYRHTESRLVAECDLGKREQGETRCGQEGREQEGQARRQRSARRRGAISEAPKREGGGGETEPEAEAEGEEATMGGEKATGKPGGPEGEVSEGTGSSLPGGGLVRCGTDEPNGRLVGLGGGGVGSGIGPGPMNFGAV